MSHEIRTPMNAIMGMAEIAKESGSPERIRSCLGKINDAAQHLLGIINDILEMSKIEAGKLELRPTDFLLEQMITRVCSVINFRVGQKRQNFMIKADRNVPLAIVADQQRLIQVVTNLLANAVKFTPEEGRITLRISVLSDDSERCVLLFEIIDTGIGIAEEQQEKLWQSFEQADGSISRRFGGTGLGLAISRNIIEAMGGTVGVESVLDRGSRFYFSIAVDKGRAVDKNSLCGHATTWEMPILVVDDAPDVLEYFEDISASLGLACRTASSGRGACRLLEEGNTFDVIFVDWMMPGMNGIELTRKIREHCGEDVTIVMISSTEWTEIEAEAVKAGVDRYIPKPLLPSLIVDCLNACRGMETAPIRTDTAGPPIGIFAGKRALLAEDVEVNREIVMTLLEDTAINIDWAGDGNEACCLFAKNPDLYDLILMDIHMPGMDGYEAAKQIRSMGWSRAANVPIIAMTANVFREDVDRCLAAGMDDHIGKLFSRDEVITKIKQYLA